MAKTIDPTLTPDEFGRIGVDPAIAPSIYSTFEETKTLAKTEAPKEPKAPTTPPVTPKA